MAAPTQDISAPKSSFLDFGRRALQFGPLLGGVVLFVLFLVYRRVLDLDGTAVQLGPASGHDPEFLGALWFWVVSSILFETSAVMVMPLLLALWLRVTGKPNLRPRVSILLGFLVVLVVWLFLRYNQSFGGGLAMQLLGMIESHMHRPITGLFTLSNAVATGAILVAALLGITLAGPHPRPFSQSLRLRGFALSTSLHASAVLLVLGVIELRALFHLAALCAPANLAAGAKVIQDVFPIAAGATFSLLLVIIHLPAAIAIHSHIDDWVAAPPEKSRAEWIAQMGIVDPLTVFSGYLAVLAPLATGLLTAKLGAKLP